MRTMFKFASSLPLLLNALPATASTSQAGNVTSVAAVSNNNIYFTQDGPRDSVPSCQATPPNTWKFDGTTPAGQIILATLLTAYAAHKTVLIQGTGVCDSDNETVLAIQVLN